MEIEIIKELIRQHASAHARFIRQAETGRRYYNNRTDILFQRDKDTDTEPLRNADNRIPFNFHGLLVNQKAAYMFTEPPRFDIGDQEKNKKLARILGDEYGKICKDLCVDASNTSVAWLHVWKDSTGAVQYYPVPSEQVVPLWGPNLKKEIVGVLRIYDDLDPDTGHYITIYEYWNEYIKESYYIDHGKEESLDDLKPYYYGINPEGYASNIEYHDIGEIPFIPFRNNNIGTNDLQNIKPLIDVYCKTFSGFFNDLEDVQEIIFVLTNYGGADLGEFLQDLKKYKAIKIDSDGSGDRSGVSTLSIQLPVEAREKLMSITRSCIMEQGMGVDPDPQNFGNSSGEALKFLYSLLDLKAGLMKTEFEISFARLIRCLCRLNDIQIEDNVIHQTWTMTSVKNVQEAAQIANQSVGVISTRSILANHPWVRDAEYEREQLEEEKRAEKTEAMNLYEGAFK